MAEGFGNCDPERVPVTPEAGTVVAVMDPVPAALKLEPVPTTMTADELVPLPTVLKAALPAVPMVVPQENAWVVVL